MLILANSNSDIVCGKLMYSINKILLDSLLLACFRGRIYKHSFDLQAFLYD